MNDGDGTVRLSADLNRKNMAFIKALAKGAGISRSRVLNDILDALSGLSPGDRDEIRERYLAMSVTEDEVAKVRVMEGDRYSASKHEWRRDVYKKISEIMRYSNEFEGCLDKAPAL